MWDVKLKASDRTYEPCLQFYLNYVGCKVYMGIVGIGVLPPVLSELCGM